LPVEILFGMRNASPGGISLEVFPGHRDSGKLLCVTLS
jgi:hypothetical protein